MSMQNTLNELATEANLPQVSPRDRLQRDVGIIQAKDTFELELHDLAVEGFIQSATDFLSDVVLKIFKGPSLSSVPNDLYTLMEEKTYQVVSGAPVRVPAGFKGKVVDLTNLLETIVPKFHTLGKDLADLNRKVAQALNGGDQLRRTAPAKPTQVGIDPDTYDKLHAMFEKNARRDVRYVNVYRNVSEFYTAVESVRKMEKELNRLNIHEINRNLDSFRMLIRDLPDLQGGLATSAMQTLTKEVERIAYLVTLTAEVPQLVEELNHALADSYVSIRDHLKNVI